LPALRNSKFCLDRLEQKYCVISSACTGVNDLILLVLWRALHVRGHVERNVGVVLGPDKHERLDLRGLLRQCKQCLGSWRMKSKLFGGELIKLGTAVWNPLVVGVTKDEDSFDFVILGDHGVNSLEVSAPGGCDWLLEFSV